jgi:DNA adenine methylase
MILRRLGNKKVIAKKIQRYFPAHDIYIEPFFGAGGMFFNKPKSNYNIVNDLDSDVFNLFQVVMNRKEEFVEAFIQMPQHQDLMNFWSKNKETDDIKKALRFICLSNFGYMGKPETLKLGTGSSQKQVLEKIDKTFEMLFEVKFSNKDFRNFLKSISLRNKNEIDKCFIYCDPPYLKTTDNYSNSFTKQDSVDLFDALEKMGCKFAISEFENDFIIAQARERKLNITQIGERQSLKNRSMEILITNYQVQKGLFD